MKMDYEHKCKMLESMIKGQIKHYEKTLIPLLKSEMDEQRKMDHPAIANYLDGQEYQAREALKVLNWFIYQVNFYFGENDENE